jgi:hypothetical protein
MNHIARTYAAPDGISYKSHIWERNGGGYRRAALLLGYPLWPVDRERRLLGFLMEKGFRIHALEIGFGGLERPRAPLAALRAAFAAYAQSVGSQSGLPLYAFVSSFSAALAPALGGAKGLAALALIAPGLAYPGLASPRCFLNPVAELAVEPDALSGKPELLAELFKAERLVLKFRKADVKSLTALRPAELWKDLGVPVALFAGDEDPFLPASLRPSLEEGGAKIYGFSRARHALAQDRNADNFFADLGSFVDEVEARSAREKKGGTFQ